jgi:protein-tyrosine phosphatase
MIDIHTHLLPGVDDGSPTVAVSLPVLEEFAAGGVEVVVCTPHLKASRAGAAPHERHQAILADLVAHAPASIRLLSGWEIMLDVPGADLFDRRLGLGGSSAILVEFWSRGIPSSAPAELLRLRQHGVVPVVAHPERYRKCSVELVEEWRHAGALMQMDVNALTGTGRGHVAAFELLNAGLIDVFASDTHGDPRSLVPARQWLVEFATPEHVELLTRVNAERLLHDQPTVPVPPLPRNRGVLHRLRELVMGKF